MWGHDVMRRILRGVRAVALGAFLLGASGPAPAARAAGTDPGGGVGIGLQVTWAPREVRQGDAFVLRVRAAAPLAAVTARFGRWPVVFWAEDREGTIFSALVGVDLEDAPGSTAAVVEARTAAGATAKGRAAIPVRRAPFPVQHLKVPRPFVELDTATLARVQRERERMEGVLAASGLDRLWTDPFRLPLDGAPPAHGFGARRVFNGEARAPHTGADFSAPAGTPVLAAQAGRVALAEDHFFPGRAVVIDHGLGLHTMYFHLQDVLVRGGDAVHAGQTIGTVGASGRATGAHLHWGARLGGARIDPTTLVRAPGARGPAWNDQ